MYVFFQKMNKNRHTCKKNLGSYKSSEANGPNVIIIIACIVIKIHADVLKHCDVIVMHTVLFSSYIQREYKTIPAR